MELPSTIEFVIPGTPHPWRAPQVVTLKNGQRIAHKEKAELQWKDTVRAEARAAGVKYQDDGPMGTYVLVVYPRPRSWPKKTRLTREPKITRPDSDNILKGIQDALQGIACRDDGQFYSSHIERVWGEPGESAHVLVRIVYGPLWPIPQPSGIEKDANRPF